MRRVFRCLREGGVPGTDSSHLEDNERVFPFVLGRGYTMSLGISDDGVRWLTEETIQVIVKQLFIRVFYKCNCVL